MNDIRRTILWVIFGFSMVLLWDQWQIHNGKKATFFPSPTQATVGATASVTAKPGPDSGVPNAVATAAPVAGAIPAPAPTAPVAPKVRFDVTTDVAKLTFDTEGGSSGAC